MTATLSCSVGWRYPEREGDHSHPLSAGIKNEWNYASTPAHSISRHGVLPSYPQTYEVESSLLRVPEDPVFDTLDPEADDPEVFRDFPSPSSNMVVSLKIGHGSFFQIILSPDAA
jgi:hypothetical protein